MSYRNAFFLFLGFLWFVVAGLPFITLVSLAYVLSEKYP